MITPNVPTTPGTVRWAVEHLAASHEAWARHMCDAGARIGVLNETALVDLPAAVRHNTLRDMERAMFGLLSMPGVNLEEATAHLTELETELVAYATARAEAIVASALDDIRVTRGAQDT